MLSPVLPDIRPCPRLISNAGERLVMNARGPLRLCLVTVTLLLASVLAAAQAHSAGQIADWHLSPVGAKGFFSRSCFAHGYMHGYEEGFYQGDMDLQFGRRFQPLKNQLRFKKIRGYQPEFGNHKHFDYGYRKGYAVGYIDAFSGRSFRAMQLVEQARLAAQSEGGTQPDRHFDDVFMHGYEVGLKNGLDDGRSETPALAADPKDCDRNASGDDTGYCVAYQRGFRLGYSDGFANQRQAAPVMAQK